VGPLSSLNDPEKGVTPQESTALIVMNHVTIREDLETLIKLMHIARNLLVNAEPEVPQDICAAVHFDQMVYQTIILCVNVTSKGYDGEILDEAQRIKLGGVTELCKCPTNINTCNTSSLIFPRQKATCNFITTGTQLDSQT
jgi:palmitoyltransferase